jgi:hypothetical protein
LENAAEVSRSQQKSAEVSRRIKQQLFRGLTEIYGIVFYSEAIEGSCEQEQRLSGETGLTHV